MTGKNLIAAVAGTLLVAALATVAVTTALDDGGDGDEGLRERVEALEERVEELEFQLGDGFSRSFPPFGAGEIPRLLEDLPLDEDLLDQLFEGFDQAPNEDLLRQLLERFGEEFGTGNFPEGGLPPDFRFNLDFDPSFIDDLVENGLLDGNQGQELREALELLREALQEAAGR